MDCLWKIPRISLNAHLFPLLVALLNGQSTVCQIKLSPTFPFCQIRREKETHGKGTAA